MSDEQQASEIVIRPEFARHALNDGGVARAHDITKLFSIFLTQLECHTGTDGRDVALMRTKLQEASFHATRAIACDPENQRPQSWAGDGPVPQ